MADILEKKNNGANSGFEKMLFKAADKLRKNMDAAEYKHIVLGLIFLKYISGSFEELHNKLVEGKGDYEGADPEDADEYRAENVFFVPPTARWSYLHSRAKLPSVGKDVDDAMEAIEKENPTLKGILPKVYARPNLDKTALGGLIDLIGDIALGDEAARSKDLLGKVYEYFLGQFANAEGKKGGQFYTPKSIVRLMVEMIEPYQGRVYDPCCGSGGMFIMSEGFVKSHRGKLDDISIYGQESNQTTYRLCRMNLALHGIDGSQVEWNNEGSFLNDAHKDLKADFILANPPFNDSDWAGELLKTDARWRFGTPPTGNANFAWLQHMIYHLSPKGIMACVLANGSLSSQTSGEGEIRKSLIENDLVDCIVALPKQLFYNTGIPACLWFMSRKRAGNGDRKRTGEILFIDASESGHLTDRTHRAFSNEDMENIAGTYHSWRSKPSVSTGESTPNVIASEARQSQDESIYQDVKGFCKSAAVEEIQKHNFVLTPGRYVGIPDEIDDGIPFEDKMKELTTTLTRQMSEEKRLDEEIKKQLSNIGFCLD
jgi:type I restriction enzyme M protein